VLHLAEDVHHPLLLQTAHLRLRRCDGS
jgi:hypothetical protein